MENKKYSWGDDKAVARDYANYGKDQWPSIAPVGSLKPNGYGLYDMGGNVWEWCQDWYGEGKEYRVLRGGSWYDDTDTLLVASRSADIPSKTKRNRGFRCVLEFPAAKQ